MSSASDGEGRPRGWMLVDKHGYAEGSEDSSSGTSSDFVDLGDDIVRYHHVSRTGGVTDTVSLASSSSFSPGVPANFRACAGASGSREDAHSSDDNTDAKDLPSPMGVPGAARSFHGDRAVRPQSHLTSLGGGGEVSYSDLANSTSSSASTLTGAQSPLLASYANGVAGDQLERAATHSEGPANILTSGSPDGMNDAEPDVLKDQGSGGPLDNISVDSIEVLAMPGEEEEEDEENHFLDNRALMGGCEEMIPGRLEETDNDQTTLHVVPALLSMAATSPVTEVDPRHANESRLSSGNEGSDMSEFERIDTEMVLAVEEGENQTSDAAEEGKMDVAGARPTAELGDGPLSDASFLEPADQPQRILETPSADESVDVRTGFLRPSVPSSSDSPDMPATPGFRNHASSGQPASGIQPFPFDHLQGGRIGLRWLASSGDFSAGLQLQPSGRFGQRRNSSSDEGFELLPRRPRGRDDDEVSTVSSSSSSDLSGFVNVRRRRGPPLSRSVSQRHSDFDDTLDSVSNFTDISEDCLPANMMIQSQKAGVRQYRHRRDEGLNTRLDWLVAMVLLAGLALGIGHFIGSTQELAHQHSINTGQVLRLRELQDDLVTCLDRSSGVDSRITTEKSSPALQAVKLLEGLNSKMMMEEDLDTSRLLEQKVGDDEVPWVAAADRDSRPAERTESRNEALSSSGVGADKKAADKNVMAVQPSSRVPSTRENPEDSTDSLNQVEPDDFHRADGLDVNINAIRDNLSPDHRIVSSDEGFDILADDSEISASQPVSGEKVSNLGKAPVETQDNASVNGEVLQAHQAEDAEFDEVVVGEASMKLGDEGRRKSFRYYDEKIESLEEKMDELMQTAQHWQEMFEESKREGHTGEAESQQDEESSSTDEDNQDETEKDEDPLAGFGATLQSLWSDWLGTDHGKTILHYLNQSQEQTVLWSEAFLREFDSLKALPNSKQAQAILNDTKLLVKHLGKEIESVTGYLKNQSAKLAEENNITAANMGEKASNAWINFKNVTSNVVNYNKKILSVFGEQLVDTLHSVENISSEFIAGQNLSMSHVTNMAEQAWGTVKNYSSVVTGTILNKTTESTKASSQSESGDDPETEPNENSRGGFGEKLRGAWDNVRKYSSNFTSNKNLSISGLREQVKAAWGKVRNTSAQVMEDISESKLADRLKDGAQKLGEKVGSTIESVKEKMKGFNCRKGRCGKEKHQHKHSERHRQAERVPKKKRKQHKISKRHAKYKNREDSSSGRPGKADTNNQHDKRQIYTADRSHRFSKDDIKPGSGETRQKQFSVPSRWHHQHQHYEFDAENGRSTTDLPPEGDSDYLNASPLQPQWDAPAHVDAESVEDRNQKQDPADLRQESSFKHDQQTSVPSRQRVNKEPITEEIQDPPNSRPSIPQERQDQQKSVPSRKFMRPLDDVRHQQSAYGSQQEDPKNDKMAPKPHGHPSKPGCSGSSDDEESDDVSSWENLFDCIDMHCRGNEKCMHSQRRDAAKLYSELLDYQEWLKDRNLKKDIRELKEFLEELGEFLSETDSDDEDLDELKDEFGEMVQDMEEGAQKRQRKEEKHRDHRAYRANTHQDKEGERAIPNDPDDVENSTVVIDLQSLPQKQHPGSVSQSHHHTEDTERWKYAGRGFHTGSDDSNWYLLRAEVRAEQRKSHRWMGDGSHSDPPNWYLHWMQGRINGRTGVTVWDMYEWIKQRYVLREELRRQHVEDHTNWFLRRP